MASCAPSVPPAAALHTHLQPALYTVQARREGESLKRWEPLAGSCSAGMLLCLLPAFFTLTYSYSTPLSGVGMSRKESRRSKMTASVLLLFLGACLGVASGTLPRLDSH
uniref:Uncharacterized protein n=1 Tax=Branchiostoma floridae TaxID=7739 RepID=C3ZZ04_BRAFL|eukprot:XP_002586195.1 hypothetical protein BRAFLDRAFT_109557 [Branchiostoma floridae]